MADASEVTDEPSLPLIRPPPRKIDYGATSHIDIVTGEIIKQQFNQEGGMPVAANLEKF